MGRVYHAVSSSSFSCRVQALPNQAIGISSENRVHELQAFRSKLPSQERGITFLQLDASKRNTSIQQFSSSYLTFGSDSARVVKRTSKREMIVQTNEA